MIIQCEKCRTRFKLDDSKISESGVRVRCSRCTHTFVVMREASEADADFDSILQGLGGVGSGERESGDHEEDREESVGPDQAEGAPAPSDEPEDDGFPAWDDDTFVDDDSPAPEEEDESGEPFSDVLRKGVGMPHFQFPWNASEPAEDEEPSVMTSSELPTSADVAQPDEAGEDEGEGPPFEAEDAARPAADQEKIGDVPSATESGIMWPAADGDREGSGEDELPPLSIASRRKGPPLFPLLLGLALLLALGGAGFYLMQNNCGGSLSALPASIKNLFGVVEKRAADAGIRSVEGAFVNNREAGELFVITGEVCNLSGKPMTALQVRGTLYGASGEALAERTVYCGNVLSREELAFQPFSSMEKAMGRQFGDSLANLEVSPGKVVPFVIVFRGMPKGTTGFGAVVAGPASMGRKAP